GLQIAVGPCFKQEVEPFEIDGIPEKEGLLLPAQGRFTVMGEDKTFFVLYPEIELLGGQAMIIEHMRRHRDIIRFCGKHITLAVKRDRKIQVPEGLFNKGI